MFNTLFHGIFDTDMTSVISVSDFLLCVGCALVIGLILARAYMYGTKYTKSFVATLALLPAVVCVVIMMVNGNVGTGVAVAGMGYLAYALLSAVILGGIMLIYNRMDFGTKKNAERYKTLHITIPEDLDYSGVFDKILKKYTTEYEVVQIKTTNMGSLFKLTYNLILKDPGKGKELIDELRCRNGNLEINICRQETIIGEL